MKKVGLVFSTDAPMYNWQQRLVKSVVENQSFETVFLYLDQAFKRETAPNSTVNSLAGTLLNLHLVFEKRLLNTKQPISLTSDFLKSTYPSITTINVTSLRKDGSKNHDFEVIVNLTDVLLSEDDINASKNGVWNILFFDAEQNRRGPIGFWEVLEGDSGIGATLCTIADNNQDRCNIRSKCFFNRAWSMSETSRTVTEGAVSMVLKELNALSDGNRTISLKPDSQLPNRKYPGFTDVFRYIYRFYYGLGAKALEKLGNAFFGIRPEKWSLFLGYGDFETASLDKLKSVPMPKDEFWADPFLFEHEGRDYVFFENYSYHTKRGKISCGILEGPTLKDVKDVMVRDYHLSFPFIFREGEDIYLMPETSANKRLELYRAVDFPVSWELYSTAFEGELVADPLFYTDSDDQRWLFINKQADGASPMNSELFIYRADSLHLKELVPHRQNPVIIDARVARNGGGIFKKGNVPYRPSQRNEDGIYGRALNINQIKKLNLEEYEEAVTAVYQPTFDKGLMALHHLHQTKKAFVFDAAYRNSLKIKS